MLLLVKSMHGLASHIRNRKTKNILLKDYLTDINRLIESNLTTLFPQENVFIWFFPDSNPVISILVQVVKCEKWGRGNPTWE